MNLTGKLLPMISLSYYYQIKIINYSIELHIIPIYFPYQFYVTAMTQQRRGVSPTFDTLTKLFTTEAFVWPLNSLKVVTNITF